MRVRVETIVDPSGRIRQLINSLGPAGKKELNAGAAAQLWADVRKHLRGYAASHHGTATRLGAQQTGHLEKAAATMLQESDADSATVTISSPGIRRALGPLTIRPAKARALTIPVHWMAYGKRVGEVARSHPVFRLKGRDVLATTIDGKLTALYVLRASVTIPQDRGILPSDEAMGGSVKRGYLGVIRNVVAKLGKGTA